MENATVQIKICIRDICVCRLQPKYIFDGARLSKILVNTITLRKLKLSSKEPRFFDRWSPSQISSSSASDVNQFRLIQPGEGGSEQAGGFGADRQSSRPGTPPFLTGVGDGEE
jgi:hypothetical protein